jgi:ribosomal protein S18 acetylase RimI-like enzyme
VNIASLKDSTGVHHILKHNLVEVRNIDAIKQKERKRLESKGFLRKEVGKEYYENLFRDPIAKIYIAKDSRGNIIGFASIYSIEYNIRIVHADIGNLSFENDETKELLLNERSEFAYLDQISILPEFQRKGVANAIFEKVLKEIDTPILRL